MSSGVLWAGMLKIKMVRLRLSSALGGGDTGSSGGGGRGGGGGGGGAMLCTRTTDRI
jgi:hypothetical protein